MTRKLYNIREHLQVCGNQTGNDDTKVQSFVKSILAIFSGFKISASGSAFPRICTISCLAFSCRSGRIDRRMRVQCKPVNCGFLANIEEQLAHLYYIFYCHHFPVVLCIATEDLVDHHFLILPFALTSVSYNLFLLTLLWSRHPIHISFYSSW